MSITTKAVVAAVATLAATSALAQGKSPSTYGFGSTPSQEELARFVSPLADGRGLPQGSGTAEQGKALYDAQCAACHGAQLQGALADKLIGGRGTLVNNDPKKAPVKTVESYWPYATTLFDYIYRAMPLNAPASLTYDQVYALCAYILSQAEIVPADATLDQASLAKVMMPNRDGFIPDPRPEKFPPPSATPHQDLKLGQALP